MLACRYFKVAQTREQNHGAVRWAVSITAMVAAYSVSACSNADVSAYNSEVVAELNLTAPVEKQLDSAQMLARGAKLYATSCRPCHGDRHGKGSIGRAHPHNEKGHSWHHPDGQLEEWILHGKPGPGISVMPGFNYFSEDDAEAILVFIKTWWTAEQREMQADISRRYDQAINKKKKRR